MADRSATSEPTPGVLDYTNTKKPKSGIGLLPAALIILVAIGFFGFVAKQFDKSGKPSQGSTPNAMPAGFNEWDGSNASVIARVKQKLGDPGSFEHVSTKVWTYPDRTVVSMQYRAINAYNAKVLETAKAECNLKGEFVRFID